MNTIILNMALNPFQRSSHVPNASCRYYNELVVGTSQRLLDFIHQLFFTLLPLLVDAQ